MDEIDNTNCYYRCFPTQLWLCLLCIVAHGNPNDGTVVLICAYLNESSTTFAHEMGHALNLPHTFDGDDPDTGTCGDDNLELLGAAHIR